MSIRVRRLLGLSAVFGGAWLAAAAHGADLTSTWEGAPLGFPDLWVLDPNQLDATVTGWSAASIENPIPGEDPIEFGYPSANVLLNAFFTAEIGPNGPADVALTLIPITLDNLVLTNGSTVTVVPFGDLVIENRNTGSAGTIQSDGTVFLTSGLGGTGNLFIDGQVRLSGGGTINSDSLVNRIAGNSRVNLSHTLVIEDHTVEGALQLGAESASIRIETNGTVRANQTERLEIDPGSDNNVVNQGLMEAVDGGTLRIKQTAVNNEGGQVSAGNGSLVELQEVTLFSGQLNSSGSGVIRGISTVTLEGPVQNTGTYQLSHGTTTFIDGPVTNAGDVHLNSTAPSTGSFGNTTLLLADNWELTGGGTITMSDFNANIITTESGEFNTLTNTDHVISGSGALLFLKVNNQPGGVIRANQSTPLVLQPADQADGFVNTGLVESVNGATLIFDISDFNNTGGQIKATDSTLRAESSATVIGGTVDLVGASVLELADGAVVGGTLNNNSASVIKTVLGQQNRISGTVNNPTGARILINDETRLILDSSGTYNNAGVIELAGQGAFAGFGSTQLLVDGSVELHGGGQIIMSNASDNAISSFSGAATLTNTDHLIQGSGQIGRNLVRVINRHSIDADQPFTGSAETGTLSIDPGNGGLAGQFVNEGTLQASNGGTLELLNGEYDNTMGVIQALDGSRVDIEQDVIIIGGQIKTTGSGQVHINRTATFDGAGITLDGDVVVNALGSLLLIGEVTNTQTLSLKDGGDVRIDGQVTLNGGGEVNLSNHVGNTILGLPGGLAGDKLINEDNAIQGVGALGFNNLAIVNHGLVNANTAGGRLTVDPGGTGEMFDNNGGTLQAADSGILRLRPGNYTNGPGGVVQALAGSLVELDNILTITGGVVAGLDGGVVRAMGGGLTGTTLDGTDGLAILGDYQIAQLATTTLKGDITHSGHIVLGVLVTGAGNSVLQIANEVTLDGGGTITMSDANLHLLRSFGTNEPLVNLDNTIEGPGKIQLNLVNHGTIQNDSASPLSIDPGTTGVFNHGLVSASGSGGLVLQPGAFVNESGGQFTANAPVTISAGATLTNQSGGLVNGNGTFAVAATGALINNGTIAPGNSTGVLTVNGNLTQGSSGLLAIELASPGGTPGSDYDQLVVTGTANLAGSVDVTFLDGFTPGYGDMFTILTADVISGSFTDRDDFIDAVDFIIDGQNPGVFRLGGSNFAVVPLLDPDLSGNDTVTFITTAPGDLNLDGTVNIGDFLVFQNNFNDPGNWFDGDFNGDGLVNIGDFLLLQNNFNDVFFTTPGGAALPTPVSGDLALLSDFAAAHGAIQTPEPAAALLLLGLGTPVLTRRRR